MIQAIGMHAGDRIRAEIRTKGWNESVEIRWADSISGLVSMDVEAYFDLDFSLSKEKMEMLKTADRPVFIAAMETPVDEICTSFLRINCWPGMLNRPKVEIAAGSRTKVPDALTILDALGWNYQLVPDIPGFISGRILATIINEAYFTLEAGVSTREQIDIAMKLGTNYPLGPFEWADQIGPQNIVKLLQRLSIEDNRYQPAALLKTYL